MPDVNDQKLVEAVAKAMAEHAEVGGGDYFPEPRWPAFVTKARQQIAAHEVMLAYYHKRNGDD